MNERGPFEQEWRRWYPHDDDPEEVAIWGEEHREFIFEQMMKIHKNLPKDMPFPGVANPTNFQPSVAVWVVMVIALIIALAVPIFIR